MDFFYFSHKIRNACTETNVLSFQIMAWNERTARWAFIFADQGTVFISCSGGDWFSMVCLGRAEFSWSRSLLIKAINLSQPSRATRMYCLCGQLSSIPRTNPRVSAVTAKETITAEIYVAAYFLRVICEREMAQSYRVCYRQAFWFLGKLLTETKDKQKWS